jgi:hypothetical protein
MKMYFGTFETEKSKLDDELLKLGSHIKLVVEENRRYRKALQEIHQQNWDFGNPKILIPVMDDIIKRALYPEGY